MNAVRQITREIVRREGGYVDDPDDPGGATKFGVTIHTMRRLGLDKTGDGKVTRADVRALTRGDAESIFETHYYTRPGIDRLPAALRVSVYDMYVNAGANAVKILQRLVRDMGFEISVDGVIGPNTVAACAAAAGKAPNHLADAYGIARRNYYYSLADRRPALRKFARRLDGGKGGWIRRAEEFISPKYHLSADQHLERTQSWS